MTARHPLQKNCSRIEKMTSRASKATTNSASFRSADRPVCSIPPTTVDGDRKSDSMHPPVPHCRSRMRSQDGRTHQEQQSAVWNGRPQRGISMGGKDNSSHHSTCDTSESTHVRDLPEQLADVLVQMCGDEGRALGDAFLYAAELPPITKQSLGELDIQNIIRNIRLRHDINFDRDLSFRPNLDGSKGEAKLKAAKQYWDALVAEMELYVRLFRGTPPLLDSGDASWPELVAHAERRIPAMFKTIREVLKSLVPDRDHPRVEEHLDNRMLMQEIERGMCDLVRLAEWLAHLLKEHCAPMRDEMVDTMVDETRSGVDQNSTRQIVNGLRNLLGILEAMKLDIANHQIRNLKTLLINDTVNFQRQYHLDRLVNRRTRVNIDAAHRWYASALARFQHLSMPQPRTAERLHLEVFSRAVISSLFTNDPQLVLPETFYLDHDRLTILKSEISDVIHFQICSDMFDEVLRELGFCGPVPQASGHVLRASIAAIIGEGMGHDPALWMWDSESIAAEIVRQAHILLRCPPVYGFDVIQRWNQRLRVMFRNRFVNHSLIMESQLRPRVLSSVSGHIHSSTVELFNNLTTIPGPSPLPVAPSQTSSSDPFYTNTFTPNPEQFTDLSNRITHILLLHWRIWGDIAYLTEEQPLNSVAVSSSDIPQGSSQPVSRSPNKLPPPPSAGSTTPVDTAVVNVMKTGEPPDPGQEAVEYAGSSLP